MCLFTLRQCLTVLNDVTQLMLFFTAIIAMGLSNLTLPSIEKRFSLTSTDLGVIMASNDVMALVLVLFISFYGDYGNKIRWIGGGGVILGKQCCPLNYITIV